MTPLRRSIAILACLLALTAGAAVLESHAADKPAPPSKSAVAAPQTRAGTAAPVGATQPRAPVATQSPPGAPQVPEESATIHDDPTTAPDPKQSADNNVSFPSDI